MAGVDPHGVPPLPRDRFPITDRLAYLNHATICAPPLDAVEAADAFNRDAMTTGGLGFLDRVASVQPVRRRLADLAGVPLECVALTKNTTEALSWLVAGMDWGPGDQVVVPAHDFPSARLPVLGLRRRDVEVVELAPVGHTHEVPLEAWAAALASGRVRLAVTSWVQSSRGFRTDLRALALLCHEHGARLYADVIQGLGVVPCDLSRWGVDAAGGGSHKWLLGPEGCGFLAVAPDLVTGLHVSEDGWRWSGTEATEKAYLRPPDETALRFEGGTLNGAGFAGLRASLDLFAGVDPEGTVVWSWVDALCEHLRAGLVDAGCTVWSDHRPEHRSAIVTFEHPHVESAALAARLAEAGVAVSVRTGGVRVSPHAYNTAAEVDRLLRTLWVALNA